MDVCIRKSCSTFNGCKKLTYLDVSGFDTSSVTTMYAMFFFCPSLTSLDLSSFNTSNVTTMLSMFYSCKELTSLDVSKFDTSKVTNMSYMFSICTKLTSLDLSNFNTSNVEEMSSMFNSCNYLNGLDISNFDISKVTSNSSMFKNVGSKLGNNKKTIVYVTNSEVQEWALNLKTDWTIENVYYEGVRCFGVTEEMTILKKGSPIIMNFVCKGKNIINSDIASSDLIISKPNIISLTPPLKKTINNGFEYTITINTLEIGNVDISIKENVVKDSNQNGNNKVTLLKILSYEDSANKMNNFSTTITSHKEEISKVYFEKMDETTINTRYNASSIKEDLTYNNDGMVKAWLEKDEKDNTKYILYVASPGTIYLQEGNDLFYGYKNISNIYFNNINTGLVRDMSYMFSGCSGLTTIDLSSFDTSNVTNMQSMFSLCEKLTTLKLGKNFKTDKVTDMRAMFYKTLIIKNLDLSNFNTSAVTDMDVMFAYCQGLETLDISNFDISKSIGNVSSVFEECGNLVSIKISDSVAKKVNVMDLTGDWKNVATGKVYTTSQIAALEAGGGEYKKATETVEANKVKVTFNSNGGTSVIEKEIESAFF